MKTPKIKYVEYKHDYILHVEFTDGAICELDLYTFLSTCKVIAVKRFFNLDKFKKVKVGEGGFDLVWPGNILDLHYEAIYNGKYSSTTVIASNVE